MLLQCKSGTYIAELLSLYYSIRTGKKIVASSMGIKSIIKYVGDEYTTTIAALLPIAVSVCYVICDTVKGISEKRRSIFKFCVLLGIAYSSSIGGISTQLGSNNLFF